MTLLGYIFRPTETASRHPIVNHWTVDWDVATIIEALEELYPLQAEHKHLDLAAGDRQLRLQGQDPGGQYGAGAQGYYS